MRFTLTSDCISVYIYVLVSLTIDLWPTCIFGPGNGSPVATNVVLVLVLAVVVIRFSIP